MNNRTYLALDANDDIVAVGDKVCILPNKGIGKITRITKDGCFIIVDDKEHRPYIPKQVAKIYDPEETVDEFKSTGYLMLASVILFLIISILACFGVI